MKGGLLFCLLFVFSIKLHAHDKKEICLLGINTLFFNKSLEPIMQESLTYLHELGSKAKTDKERERIHKLEAKFKKEGASAKYCQKEMFLEEMDHFSSLSDEYLYVMKQCLKDKKPLAFLAKHYGLSPKHIKSYKELKQESLIQLDIDNPNCPIHNTIKSLDYSFIHEDTNPGDDKVRKKLCVEYLGVAQEIYRLKAQCKLN